MSKVLAVRDAVKLLGVDRTTLYAWERRGLVTPLRDYRNHRFYRARDIERLRRMRERRQPSPSRQTG